jgi:hypothetical protein
MSSTLLLSRAEWDLTTDSSGNIAVASPPYAHAQDAASSMKLFRGEYIYDTTVGIPYFQQVLGKTPPINLVRSLHQAAAKSVPGVVSAKVYYTGLSNGQLSGQAQITDNQGNISIVGIQ